MTGPQCAIDYAKVTGTVFFAFARLFPLYFSSPHSHFLFSPKSSQLPRASKRRPKKNQTLLEKLTDGWPSESRKTLLKCPENRKCAIFINSPQPRRARCAWVWIPAELLVLGNTILFILHTLTTLSHSCWLLNNFQWMALRTDACQSSFFYSKYHQFLPFFKISTHTAGGEHTAGHPEWTNATLTFQSLRAHFDSDNRRAAKILLVLHFYQFNSHKMAISGIILLSHVTPPPCFILHIKVEQGAFRTFSHSLIANIWHVIF